MCSITAGGKSGSSSSGGIGMLSTITADSRDGGGSVGDSLPPLKVTCYISIATDDRAGGGMLSSITAGGDSGSSSHPPCALVLPCPTLQTSHE